MSDTAYSPPSSVLPATYTVATLPAPALAMVGLYARVTDLFGEKTDLVLCSVANGVYFWQPVRPIYAKSLAADANQTLIALQHPSVIYLTGGLTASRTITFSTANAWPGASFELAMAGTLGIYGLTLAGLDLGATVSLLLGGRQRVFFDGSTNTWKAF
jgi:hypothetical protein